MPQSTPTPPPPPPVQAPLAPEVPGDSPEANRAAATARRRLRVSTAPKGAGTGLRLTV
jgi:hypothetical protein